MMAGLGVLDAIRPSELAASERIRPARPGDDSAPVLSVADRSTVTTSRDALATARHVDAQLSLERALRRVQLAPTSTNKAALAQTYATLGQMEQARDAARDALDTSATTIGGRMADAPSARIAAEVLLRSGDPAYAYEVLRDAPLTSPMSVTVALLATALGDLTEAERILAPHHGALVDSFRGYLYTSAGRWQDAVRQLRGVVSSEPGDVDALLNLSIAMWNMGSKVKATRVALQATRTAPGRKDLSLHYMELLLDQGETSRLRTEIRSLLDAGVVPDGNFLVLQARAQLARGEVSRAVSTLDRAADAARADGDGLTEGTALGNGLMLRRQLGRISRESASEQLVALMSRFPDNDAIIANYAEIAQRAGEAAALRTALTGVDNVVSPIRETYLRHQLAVLEGDADAAGRAAEEWFELEPNNVMAATAAVIGMGIGQGRWEDAVIVAEHALSTFGLDRTLVNNSAYVLAMSGRAEEAIALLAPIAGDDYVLNATLGLAYLAHGDLDQGMRYYRRAADTAEKQEPEARILMSAYQALIVRQLGIDRDNPPEVLEALALVPIDLPEDWRDRPDFLRLRQICDRHGYPWPLTL